MRKQSDMAKFTDMVSRNSNTECTLHSSFSRSTPHNLSSPPETHGPPGSCRDENAQFGSQAVTYTVKQQHRPADQATMSQSIGEHTEYSLHAWPGGL